MQRAPKASSKCQGKASALTRARLSLPARRRLRELGTSLGSLGLVGAKNSPNLDTLTAALKPCNRKKILQIVLGFTPSNDILTASISGTTLLFSPWSSINALPQNSYEPAGLLHSSGCELLPASPLVQMLMDWAGCAQPGPKTPPQIPRTRTTSLLKSGADA